MKKKDIQDIKTKSIAELRKLSSDAVSSLMSLKLDHTQFKLKNTRSIFLKRKELARIKTFLTEKEAQEKDA